MERENKVVLLCEYKMVKMNWSAWTPESYAATLMNLSDEDIELFYKLPEEELNLIKLQVDEYAREQCR